MVAVSSVPVAFMDVIGVVPVRHGFVAAPVAMAVLMLAVGDMVLKHAFVPVTVVVPVDVAVMEIVGVVAVLQGDVTAVVAVGMTVRFVGVVGGSAHAWCSSRDWSGG
jgi:hypothetical protein